MKPLNLTLKDYRAFTAGEISLSSVNAAAIVGPNGAGKSSVCEAIIWSLFGEGRSSGVDGVVRLGADEASVQLDYEHAGNVYRVIRKRSRGKRSDLQYLLAEGGEWKPLSGAGIRETQEKIIRDLAMDESLFLNSSCVMQGRSAGICEATPAERKAVLYRILEDRLAKFGPLHDAAKATVKGLDDAMIVARSKRRDLEERVGLRPEEEACLAQAQRRIEELTEQLKAAEDELEAHRRKQAEHQVQRDRIGELEDRVAKLSTEVGQLQNEISRNQQIIASAQELAARADDIRAQCDEATALEAELEGLAKAKEQYRELIQQHKDRQAQLEADVQRIKLQRSAELAKIDSERSEKRSEHRVFANTLRSLEEQIADTQRRALLLQEVPCKGSPMAEECKLLADARLAADRLEALRTRAEECERRQAALDEAITELDSKYRELGEAQERELAEAGDLAREEMTAIKERALALGYDSAIHSGREVRYGIVKAAREMLPELSAAEARMAAANAAIAAANTGLTEKLEAVAQAGFQLEEAKAAAAKQADPLLGAALENKVSDIRGQIDQQNRALAVCEERLARIAAAEEELQAVNAGLLEQERKRAVYATLQQAFGRDGIPALIIDAAVPQIEEHANEILAHLSDGRMSLRFVTQKAKSTGGIAETLDIIVSDSQGERPYEDWSGGEKLRIDLAVRIALGQVLAQRTGAKIELLILDEVCAPLDEAGEEALIECIQRLQDSFGCILLITHRESLKDRLPQQIVISKNGAGSEVSLVA